MARVHFPSLVAPGENPNAQCLAQNANGTILDGVGGDGDYASFNSRADGPRWGSLGKVMLAAMAPSLKPRRNGK